MIEKRDWNSFYNSGLLLIINQILHIFGWAIVFSFDDETKEIIEVYPARCKFRGFTEDVTSKSYKAVTHYMNENIKELLVDVKDLKDKEIK